MAARLAMLVIAGTASAEPRHQLAEAIDDDDCPVEGRGGDDALNRLKNRVDAPRAVERSSLASMIALPVPEGVERRARRGWAPSVSARVDPIERRAVVVEAMLVHIKRERGEAVNCHAPGDQGRDFHLYLAETSEAPHGGAVVAEITPRVRALHPGWSFGRLRRLVRRARVRVTGLLLLDEKHLAEVGRSRATVWEIHPVTRLEYLVGDAWTEL